MLIEDDNGDIIRGLFYDNVRDWQEYNEVNTEIRETLKCAAKDMFVLMNNGITIISRTIQPTGNRFYISDYQIVNGCQTSHVLFEDNIRTEPFTKKVVDRCNAIARPRAGVKKKAL